MKGKLLLLSGAAIALSANAQQLKPDYLTWPSSQGLAGYVKDWKAGQQLMEDENFFISRVKPKTHFRNTATQIFENFNESNDKRLVFWVPVGNSDVRGVHTDALPNGVFDSEVFSMWPYVTHYGDWISPHGWVPGGFADAAHKHGTIVSGVASIPWGSITSDWNSAMTAQVALDNEKLAHFLYYHGVNGLGYNSEFSGGGSFIKQLIQQHEDVVKYFKQKGMPIENVWYDGVTSSGSLSFSEQLCDQNAEVWGDADHVRTHLFVNYNWNTPSRISATTQKAEAMGRTMLDLYAGHNMQGGTPTRDGWARLAESGYSIGLWGAHATNMLWQNRNVNGSSPEALQGTYQKELEQFFGNGPRNPIAKLAIPEDEQKLSPSDNYMGMSRLMSARSSLSWDLTDEPFVTYFNLGNGRYFNWKGQRQNDNEWYNLGVQDYMPTWRWWFADKFLGKEPSNIPQAGLDANFIWSDAWMGGSCLNVTGSVTDEYLHLFKTQFMLQSDDKITVRYKLAKGSAKVNLVVSAEGAESTILRESAMELLAADTEADEDVWLVKEITVSGPNKKDLNGKTIAMIGLHFADVNNVDFRLGEISITRGAAKTPNKPNITLSRVLANNSNGVDGKLIFNMASPKPVDEPTYNLDVNTSLFRLYSQQEGCEPVNVGATSSWAAFLFSCPVDRSLTEKVRFGVSAVSTDFATESEIAWTDYQELGDYTMDDHIAISKTVIKPNEAFEVYFLDPKHDVADWKITDKAGAVIASANGTQAIAVDGIANEGVYDLTINEGKPGERILKAYVQISSWATGALPVIESIGMGDKEAEAVEIEPLENIELSYTGRECDGFASRGVSLEEKHFGTPISELGLQPYQSFSIAAWVRLSDLATGTYSFMTIEDRAGTWPKNNWGYFWCRINQDGQIINSLHDSAYGGSLDSNSEGMRLYCDYRDSYITPNAWVHVVFVFEYNNANKIRYRFYLNGERQNIKTWLHANKGTRESNLKGGDWMDFETKAGSSAYGNNVTETDFVSSGYPITTKDWITFGGTCQNINAMSGVIDDVQVWSKAMTDEDVKTSMAGLDATNLPADVLAWWDLDTDCGDDYGFLAKGSKAGAKAYKFDRIQDEKEGQMQSVPVFPDYSAGSPFLSGESYAVKTLPTWTGKKAIIENAEGNATTGKASVSYKSEGDYTVTLKLENAHGSDVKEYPVITVKKSTALEAVEAENVEVYTNDGYLFVDFAEAGTYDVNVYTVAGVRMSGKSVTVNEGGAAKVRIANAGVYVVNVARDGKAVRNVKVVVR